MKKLMFAFAALGFLAFSHGAQAQEYVLSQKPLITFSVSTPAPVYPVYTAPRVVEYVPPPRIIQYAPRPVEYVPYGQWKKEVHQVDWRYADHDHGYDFNHGPGHDFDHGPGHDFDHDRR